MRQKNIDCYFDWAATAPPDEDILQSALDETLAVWGNPSSQHAAGKAARGLLEAARALCAAALGVPTETIFFTSGGTESDQIPLLSMLNRPQKGSVLVSAIEHPAVREQAAVLAKCGWRVIAIPPTSEGFVTPDAVLANLQDDTTLVCVMAVNNETGAVQNVAEIADALVSAAKRRVHLHVDCVQAAGKIPLDLSYKRIASAAFSAHKICGPRGIGALYLADGANGIEPFLRGGGQEKNIRSGTENVYGALALAKCLERYCTTEKNETAQKRFALQKKLTRAFLEKIAALPSCAVIPRARMDAPFEERFSPWIVQAAFKNIPGQVMQRALDAEGFCISTGSACSSRKNKRPVLEAMNVDARLRENAVRFSFGPHSTEAGMDALADAVAKIAARFN